MNNNKSAESAYKINPYQLIWEERHYGNSTKKYYYPVKIDHNGKIIRTAWYNKIKKVRFNEKKTLFWWAEVDEYGNLKGANNEANKI